MPSIQALYEIYQEANAQIAIDTRTNLQGALFFCIRGSNFDAHEFIDLALEKGAYRVVIDDERYTHKPNTFLVANTLTALQDLAKHHRLKLKTPILAITGSNGKTTTKELLHRVVSKKYQCLATEGNLNNHIGIPLTLLKLRNHHEFAIVEMGANHQKEIESYCTYTLPDLGLITNIGKAHLEGFGGEEGVRKGKTELFEYLKSAHKPYFVNLDDPKQLSFIREDSLLYSGNDPKSLARGIVSLDNTEKLLVQMTDGISIQTNLTGAYNLPNVLAAVALGHYLNINTVDIVKALENYTPQNNRSQIEIQDGYKLILDCYNANPDSMKAALENLKAFKEPKIAVLGGMKELGVYEAIEHEKIVDIAISLPNITLILIGPEFKPYRQKANAYFEHISDAKSWWQHLEKEGKVILLKGSRGSGLEKILHP
ncbi:MAG: UDP-N-acetylmuramoyl-tripeptide--D-alanyl-D-alanine ligase [Chitinophagales bacterium]|jgi:UDP-N-acetylmuramoyl-tripeptide--D-alanyl-D-alanine ligase|nr:UDP-N-acetylmuramoyl-tripeptide--D-alanyl-D-alanine ligase [Chitinophagales bacterium]